MTKLFQEAVEEIKKLSEEDQLNAISGPSTEVRTSGH
jgi:hypothetical protein